MQSRIVCLSSRRKDLVGRRVSLTTRPVITCRNADDRKKQLPQGRLWRFDREGGDEDDSDGGDDTMDVEEPEDGEDSGGEDSGGEDSGDDD